MTSARKVALWVTQEEAEAMLSVLLNAPPTEEVPCELAEHLLCRVAHVQRRFAREAALESTGSKGGVSSESMRRRVRRAGRRPAVRRVPRSV